MPEPVITAARTTRHSLPYLFPGQVQKEAFVNEALVRLDALVHLAVSEERADPPADPAPGDCYIVGPNPSGAWSGHSRSIATWAESLWLFASAAEGMQAYDRASGSIAVYRDAVGWQRVTAPPDPAGGAVQDSEARAAIAVILAGMKSLGFFA